MVDNGVALVGGLGLWLQSAPLDRVVVITGTKGKSTTTAVLGHLLERLGHRCFIGGNIGRVPYAADVDESHYDYWALEVSSYQATDLAVSPRVVAVTSLHPDHLPWHGGEVEHYYRDKLSACTQPGAEWTVANAASETLRRARRAARSARPLGTGRTIAVARLGGRPWASSANTTASTPRSPALPSSCSGWMRRAISPHCATRPTDSSPCRVG